VPAGVRELALRLLSKSVGQRPASATIVRAKLAVAVADESGALKPLLHEPLAAPAPVRRNRLWPALAALAALAALGAVFLLPRMSVEDSALAQKAREEAVQAGLARQSAEAARAAEAEARELAEAARTRFAAAFKSAESRAAARWATADFARARDGGTAAGQRFAVGDYSAAARGWDEASAVLATLEQSAPAALAGAVKRGEAALAQADTNAARAAFELALAIQPNHPPAAAGIARAGRLDEALALVDAARRDEQAGRLAAAEAGYRKALATDGGVPGAQEALDRMAAGRSADAYSVAMSRGFAESAAGRTEAARAAFNQALAARPGSREATEAIAALDRGQRASAVSLLEARARTAEGDERWDEALEAWREAATLEPKLESAREGIARATPRAELQRRIDALIGKPERLWNAEGRAEARGLVAAAQAAGNPREKLAASAARLEALAAAAQSPVRLRLESDGQTQVAIYRVGQYGTFATREVQLLPGRYTVVGTRTGYRDVRRELVLPPGAPAASVVVRCEEPI
jgi:hypothetical protein